ncbi:MAG TPA: hypothetical protein VK689_13095 [Armatimonadota bacterium]|nr:hypothetical protein [Armatimonadota bacterium]
MASERDWANGYYQQALADMNAARVLQGQEPSVLAMLLQMLLEKLAKAALLRSGLIPVARATQSHAAASALVQQLWRNRRACERLGFKPEVVRFNLAPIVEQLERSHPQFAQGGPSLEYPWETPSGEVQWPAAHLEVARKFRPRSLQGQMLFEFASRLCDRFEQVFP